MQEISGPQISIIIPVYNEGENITTALIEIKNKVTADYEILVVYDFDTDTTLPVVTKLIASNEIQKIKLIKNNLGRGPLNAIKTGFNSAQGHLIVVTMADLSDPPEVINDMVAKANAESLDIVCASRYMAGGQQIGGPLFKRILSQVAGLSLNLLVNIPTQDISNNFRLYRSSFLKSVTIDSTGGFELATELTVKAHLMGKRIGQVPTTWRDRTAGQSNFKLFKWLPKYFKWYLFLLKGHYLK